MRVVIAADTGMAHSTDLERAGQRARQGRRERSSRGKGNAAKRFKEQVAEMGPRSRRSISSSPPPASISTSEPTRARTCSGSSRRGTSCSRRRDSRFSGSSTGRPWRVLARRHRPRAPHPACNGRACRAAMVGSPCIAAAHRRARGWYEDQIMPAKRERQLLVTLSLRIPSKTALTASRNRFPTRS